MEALTPRAALEAAVQYFGTETGLAKAIGMPQQSINDVMRAGRITPATWCLKIENATGGKVTRHQLRPDLYPEEASEAAE